MRCAREIPPRAGVGLKPRHYRAILDTRPDIGWFEVHAENYMGAGGEPHHFLSAIRQHYPLSLHGVGLSIGSAEPLDKVHLRRLRELIARYDPGLFSEHLAWSSHDGAYLSDLLPLPYTSETVARVAAHIDEVQQFLGRQMLLENPSSYVSFAESTLTEISFLEHVVRVAGCGLLLDVNNVQVSSINRRASADDYIEAFPLEAVGELHLAGSMARADSDGEKLLIDTHDRPVEQSVWDLYASVLRRTGPLPTLIEWDANVPDWPDLFNEAKAADRLMSSEDRAVILAAE
jgi:uncharacterized protein (UPF0276 family)